MKHDIYAVYIIVIVAIVGLVSLVALISGSTGDLAGQAFGKFEMTEQASPWDNPFFSPGGWELEGESQDEDHNFVSIGGRTLEIGDRVTVKTTDGKFLIGDVTAEGLVIDGVLTGCPAWQGSVCLTTADSGKFI